MLALRLWWGACLAPVRHMQELTFPTVNPPVKRRRLRLRGLALPNEHGSWSVLFEPLVAGIVVAPSIASPFIGLLFVGGFLAHQPLRVCLTDLRNRRKMPHTSAAVALASAFLALAGVGLAGAWMIAGFSSLVPLLAAAPLALLQLGYDLAGKSRRAVPEIAGAIALSSSAAISAHAAGWSAASSLGLWFVFALRVVPSLLYVRNRLLLEKRKAAATLSPIVAHIVALASIIGLAIAGLSSPIVVLVFALLLVRAAVGLSSRRRKLKATQIGIMEVVFGSLTVLSVVIGHYFHI